MRIMKKYLTHIVWAVIVILALSGGFFWGRAGSGNQAASGSSAAGSRVFRSNGSGGFMTGQILAVSPNNLTVSLANGNSEVVFYSSSTEIMKPSPVPSSSLGAGTRVTVVGTANSDGSFTAQSIQVQPNGGFAGGSGQ